WTYVCGASRNCFRGCCFFFSSRRRHTRSYGDWSSDVCSSDLLGLAGHGTIDLASVGESILGTLLFLAVSFTIGRRAVALLIRWRSEERRVGKEGRARWASSQAKREQCRGRSRPLVGSCDACRD